MSKNGKASFKCNSQLLDNFRRAVAEKYGRLYGVLCVEFEKALQARLIELKKEAMKHDETTKQHP